MIFSGASVHAVYASQAGTTETDHLTGATIGRNGTYVFAGSTRGDWNATSNGKYDAAAFKVDARGDILWRWQVNNAKNPSVVTETG